MSTQAATIELDDLLPGTEARDATGRFEVVATRAQRRARPRLLYPVIAVAGVGAILLTQLALSMVNAQGAYRISELQAQNVQYGRQVQALAEQQQKLSSTQNLAMNAAALGMVGNAHRAYLRLSTGAVVGTPGTASTTDGTVSATDLVPNALLQGVAPVAGTAAPAAGAAAAGATATGATTAGGVAAGQTATGPAQASAPNAADTSASGQAAAGQPVASGTDTGELPSPQTR